METSFSLHEPVGESRASLTRIKRLNAELNAEKDKILDHLVEESQAMGLYDIDPEFDIERIPPKVPDIMGEVQGMSMEEKLDFLIQLVHNTNTRLQLVESSISAVHRKLHRLR